MKIAAMPLLLLLLAGKVRGQSADGFDPNANNEVRQTHPDTLWLSMHSVSSNAIYNSQAGVDDAIEVKADDVILKTGQPAVTS